MAYALPPVEEFELGNLTVKVDAVNLADITAFVSWVRRGVIKDAQEIEEDYPDDKKTSLIEFVKKSREIRFGDDVCNIMLSNSDGQLYLVWLVAKRNSILIDGKQANVSFDGFKNQVTTTNKIVEVAQIFAGIFRGFSLTAGSEKEVGQSEKPE